MSNIETPPPPLPPPRTPPPAQRDGCMTALMVVVGVILLLPGLCALLFGADALLESHPEPIIMLLVLVGLLVGFAGIMLIRAAVRGRRP